ncbi:hypothetical protein [Brachybacterium sp. AOP29-B2-41]|uniref:hypothetical protein n=1 Tax=Brachybacterium sp. AOP29-B2-41 TaxID=3457704 RepID=UPI0040333E89
MKISWQGTSYAQVGFRVELDEYDASPPVRELLLDHAPVFLNPEREAIAAYLAFGFWASGNLQLPHKLGPNTASAIERDLGHVEIRPNPIEYYPKPLDGGIRGVHVKFSRSGVLGHEPTIAILPTSEWVGSMRSLDSILLGSNAFTLDAASSVSFEQIRARLAVAVLLAGDLSADVLHVSVPSEFPGDEKSRLVDLLLATRLGLVFE